MRIRERLPGPAGVPVVRHLFEGLSEYAIFALHPGGEIACWSSGGEALTGFPAGEVIGRPLSALWATAAERADAPALARAAESGSSTIDGWAVRRDGTTFWAEGTLSAIRNDSGPGLAGFAVVFRDATLRKRGEDRLRLSQATFEGILAIASDAVVCISEGNRVTFFNRGAEAIFGYAADEVIGQPLNMLIPEYARPAHPQHIRDFAASGVSARRMGERGEISGRRKDGSIFPAEASISKLEVGGTRVFTAVLRDITERRRAEEAIEAHARDLARSNQELEQFAYVASHDLQEPLRMVASYTQLLARRYRGQLDADADEFIGYAVDGVRRMQELIDDLLAYSRVGSRGSEMVEVAVGDVLGRVLGSLAHAIEEAGATVTADPLPSVQADALQLVQLFQNLIGNAVKFRGEEAPRVHVSARRGAGEWVFSVRDNGIGIAPEFAHRIFVIFQRLHSRGEYPGTGIGLAICRKIVERHGGTIWVESAPGQGSTFHFSLPDPHGVSP